MSRLLALALLALSLPLVNADEKDEPINDERFHKRLLKIAKVYEKFRRVDEDARLAMLDCRAPSRYLGVPRISESDDPATHGKKVYYLYAKNRQAYRDVAKSVKQKSQVVVKETWRPLSKEAANKEKLNVTKRPATVDDILKSETVDRPLIPIEKGGKRHFVPGEANGLFVMFQNQDKKLRDATDEGWVYGTVSADRKTVTSAGRVSSCIGCHESAPHGRLFGAKDLPTFFTKQGSKKPNSKKPSTTPAKKTPTKSEPKPN